MKFFDTIKKLFERERHDFNNTYNIFPGLDVKFSLFDPDRIYTEGELKKNGRVGACTGVSFGMHPLCVVGGTIVLVISDGFDYLESPKGMRKRLVIHWARSSNNIVKVVDKIIKFDDFYSWGVSLDDIIVDASINFITEKDITK